MTAQTKNTAGWISAIVAVLLLLGTMFANFTPKSTGDQHEKRITVLEETTVKTREMDSVKNQMNRIEDKLDRVLEGKAR